MSIVFRCPECGHKVRAANDIIGKQARCKCGALIDVPRIETAQQSSEVFDPSASTWALTANSSEEPISAWSPLLSEAKNKGPADFSDWANHRWRAILMGVAGLLGLILVVGLGALVLSIVRRPATPPDVQVAQNNPPVEVKTPPEPATKKQNKVPDPPVVVPPAPKKEPKKEPVAPPPLPLVRGLALANPPGREIFRAKPPPPDSFLSVKDRRAIEIIHWYTAPSFVVEDSPGKTQLLSLNKEAAAKLGMSLIAVQVRQPAEPLIGKEFMVHNPDAKLIGAKDKTYLAIGIRVSEDVWFAPTKGQRLYLIDSGIPMAGPVQQGWLFIAPLADLEAGRLSFQFRDQAPVPLKAGARRTIPK